LTRFVGMTAAIDNSMNDTKPSKVEMLRFLLEERASKGASEEELNDLKRAIRRHSGKGEN